MNGDETKAYSDHIRSRSDAMIAHQITTMTSAKAIRIIKDATNVIRTAPDPDGENMAVEIRLSVVAQWLTQHKS